MAEIVIQFSTQKNLVSNILHYYDHTWCSHVDAVLPDGGLLGAKLIKGVAIRKFENGGFSKTLTVHLPTTDTICYNFYDFCNSQIGKPYDWRAILAFAVSRDWRDDDSWFCSEFIAAGLEKSKYFPYPIASGLSKVTPECLLLMLNATAVIADPTLVVGSKWIWF